MNRVKKAVYTAVSLLFIITFTATGMKRAADGIVADQPSSKMRRLTEKEHDDEISNRPYEHDSYKASLKSTVIIPNNALVGFGDSNCIAALNKAGIPAESHWPLVVMRVPTPKQKPEANQTFCTEEVPPQIIHGINAIMKNQLQKEEKELSSLIGSDDNTWSQNKWRLFEHRKNDMHKSAQRKIEKFQIPVPLIPVHNLYSKAATTNIQISECFDLNLQFDQHERLDRQLQRFTKIPGMFSLLEVPTEHADKEITRLQSLPQATDEEMEIREETIDHLKALVHKKTKDHRYATEKELWEEKKLLQFSLRRPKTSQTIYRNLLYHTNNAFELTDKDIVRNLLLTQNLKKNPLKFTHDRQIGLKK